MFTYLLNNLNNQLRVVCFILVISGFDFGFFGLPSLQIQFALLAWSFLFLSRSFFRSHVRLPSCVFSAQTRKTDAIYDVPMFHVGWLYYFPARICERVCVRGSITFSALALPFSREMSECVVMSPLNIYIHINACEFVNMSSDSDFRNGMNSKKQPNDTDAKI